MEMIIVPPKRVDVKIEYVNENKAFHMLSAQLVLASICMNSTF